MRARSWCFTSYKTSADLDYGECRYICWGEEVCPSTGRPHLQGYVEFESAVTRSSAARRIGDASAHFERRRGTQKQAIEYTCKVPGGAWEEHGSKGSQGKRTDLDAVRDCLADGGTLREVLDTGASYQGVRYAEKVLTYRERVRSSPPHVVWCWGPTGTGKSRYAAEASEAAGHSADDIYWHAGGKWWDGYDGHGVVIMDDFRPEDLKFQFLLRLLDRYPFRVEVKGGYRQFRSPEIYITCPKHPSECYRESGEDLDQLIRRINEIKEFE